MPTLPRAAVWSGRVMVCVGISLALGVFCLSNGLLRTRRPAIVAVLELMLAGAFSYPAVREKRRRAGDPPEDALNRLAAAAALVGVAASEHMRRVAQLSEGLSLAIGLSAERASQIGRAALLHDVGKICIPDDLLQKPGEFTPEEYDLIKTHTRIGAQILSGSPFRVLKAAERIARSHHERWDGTGYPQGLRGAQTPLEARIVALADVFDALTHERPYKRAWNVEEALAEIERQSGRQFDPNLVPAFCAIVRGGLAIPAPSLPASAATRNVR